MDVAANCNLQRETVCVCSVVTPEIPREEELALVLLSMPENSNKRRKYSMNEKEGIYVKFLG